MRSKSILAFGIDVTYSDRSIALVNVYDKIRKTSVNTGNFKKSIKISSGKCRCEITNGSYLTFLESFSKNFGGTAQRRNSRQIP